MEQLMVKM